MTSTTLRTDSAATSRGVVRWFFREIIGTIMAGVILFFCAGRWDWLGGWMTIVTVVYYVGGTALVLLPKNPALLAERSGPKHGAKKWDALIMSLVGTIILVIYIVGGLDARNSWTSSFPTWAQVVGFILTMLGYTPVLWAIASNTFFSLIVRIQKERGHTVASGGSYRSVRHPGYVRTILAC